MASIDNISLKAEKILEIGSLDITNAMLGSIVVLAIIVIFSVLVGSNIKKEGTPTKIQSGIEMLYLALEKMTHDALGAKKTRQYLGLVLALFVFIVLGSWFGLVPGVIQLGVYESGKLIPLFRAPTSDLNATLALSIIAFLTIQFSGFSSLGFFGYLSKFFTIKGGPVNSILGILELVFEFVRLISFSVRLFGNIFAGELLIIIISYLSKGVPVTSLVVILEFFVALIQAYVFVNLMAIFISLAATPAHHDEAEHPELKSQHI